MRMGITFFGACLLGVLFARAHVSLLVAVAATAAYVLVSVAFITLDKRDRQ